MSGHLKRRLSGDAAAMRKLKLTYPNTHEAAKTSTGSSGLKCFCTVSNLFEFWQYLEPCFGAHRVSCTIPPGSPTTCLSDSNSNHYTTQHSSVKHNPTDQSYVMAEGSAALPWGSTAEVQKDSDARRDEDETMAIAESDLEPVSIQQLGLEAGARIEVCSCRCVEYASAAERV